jgi:hypothetical protein
MVVSKSLMQATKESVEAGRRYRELKVEIDAKLEQLRLEHQFTWSDYHGSRDSVKSLQRASVKFEKSVASLLRRKRKS